MSFMRTLRKHMNKMIIFLAVALAITLTATTTMTDFFGRLMQPKWATMFGERVSEGEFQNVRKRIVASRILVGGGRDERMDDDEVWEYFALIKEAERTGVIVTKRELKDQILGIYKRIKLFQASTQEELWQKRMELSRLTQEQLKARLEAIPFNRGEYGRIVESRFSMSVPEFENMVREILLINNLLNYVKAGAIVSSEKVYDNFLKKNHRRKIDYIHFDSEDYVDKLEIAEEDVQAFYEERSSYYEQPERISFEYIMASYDDMEKTFPKPTEEELQEFYNRKRGLLFTKKTQEEESVESPDDIYKPYEEVKSDVEYFFNKERSEKKAKELVRKVASEVNEGEPKDFLDIAELAAAEGLVVGESQPFAEAETFRLESEFGHCAQAARMFDATDVGVKFEGPYACTKGEFFYRISKHIPKHVKPLEDVREELLRALKNKKASELAETEAERIRKEAEELKSFTDDFIVKEQLPRVSTEFFMSVDNNGDIKTIESADRDIINAAFNIEEEKGFAGPVKVNVAGKDQYYVMQYTVRLDPNPVQFLDKKLDLFAETEDELGSQLIEDWKKDLMRRADVQKHSLEKDAKAEETTEKAAPEGEAAGDTPEPPVEEEPADK